jgi:hypothetical protein
MREIEVRRELMHLQSGFRPSKRNLRSSPGDTGPATVTQ